MNLPLVTEETINEMQGLTDEQVNQLYMKMAAANPHLYRTAYGICQLPETTKDVMLGVIVAMYHCLDRELGKQKSRKRGLKHAPD